MALFKDVKVGDYYRRLKAYNDEHIITKVTPSHITAFIIWHKSTSTPARISTDYSYSKYIWNRCRTFPVFSVSIPNLNDKKRIVSTIFAHPLERQ